jgi:DNA-binding transcriptional LysR family regulator
MRIPSHPSAVFNYLDTQIAMVETGEAVAIIPSFVLPACRNRQVVLSRLVNSVVNLDFCPINNRRKKLPSGAEEFTAFLKNYITRWAGRAGILYALQIPCDLLRAHEDRGSSMLD